MKIYLEKYTWQFCPVLLLILSLVLLRNILQTIVMKQGSVIGLMGHYLCLMVGIFALKLYF